MGFVCFVYISGPCRVKKRARKRETKGEQAKRDRDITIDGKRISGSLPMHSV